MRQLDAERLTATVVDLVPAAQSMPIGGRAARRRWLMLGERQHPRPTTLADKNWLFTDLSTAI